MGEASEREAAGRGYVFQDRDEEERRLIAQARLFAPSTERAFRAAGLGRGMRVLDLGTGAGDVAMLAARLVGRERGQWSAWSATPRRSRARAGAWRVMGSGT